MRKIEIRREQHRRSSEASEGGNCPFLKEPCLNIQRKGVSSLSNYFRPVDSQGRPALRRGSRSDGAGGEQRDQAREVRKYYDKSRYVPAELAMPPNCGSTAERGSVKLAEEQAEIEKP